MARGVQKDSKDNESRPGGCLRPRRILEEAGALREEEGNRGILSGSETREGGERV